MLNDNIEFIRTVAKNLLKLANEMEAKQRLVEEVQERMKNGNREIHRLNIECSKKDAYIASLEAELQHIGKNAPELKLSSADRAWLFPEFNGSVGGGKIIHHTKS